jgi:6-hydroxynicotinate 3-monooxygenase
MGAKLSIGVIGAGMGGLATAAALLRVGVDVTVYEQASKFARLGAGIQVGCNAMQVLRALGLEQRIRGEAFYPRSWNNRDWRTGEVRYDQIFGPTAEAKYGAPYLLAHRGDLHATLASAVPAERIRLGHKLAGLDDRAGSVVLGFDDGSTAVHDGVVAADGVHSLVRELLFGAEKPSFTGRIAYRTTYPAALLGGYDIDECTKWWGEDRHIVIYYVKPDRSEVYFVTSQPEPGFTVESWSAKGDMPTLRAAFDGFHPQVQQVLAACPDVHKWALADRDPLPRWQDGNVTLLGDACHPMTPYMAQGAAMALEDAAVLSRLLAEVDDPAGIPGAFRRLEATRKPRTSRVQLTSRTNTWLREKTDVDWVYSYNPWTAPLAADECSRLVLTRRPTGHSRAIALRTKRPVRAQAVGELTPHRGTAAAGRGQHAGGGLHAHPRYHRRAGQDLRPGHAGGRGRRLDQGRGPSRTLAERGGAEGG